MPYISHLSAAIEAAPAAQHLEPFNENEKER